MKGTIAARGGQSLAGHTSKELETQFKVPVQQTLTALVRTGILTRDTLTDVYVYFSVGHDRAKEQMTARCQFRVVWSGEVLPGELVIEVLAEAIRSCQWELDHEAVIQSLRVRDQDITRNQIDQILAPITGGYSCSD